MYTYYNVDDIQRQNCKVKKAKKFIHEKNEMTKKRKKYNRQIYEWKLNKRYHSNLLDN